ncbi:hypothetical protein L0V05_19020 [Tabrizicola sp. J26]|uniref:nickel/cobalt transporter n=1 Tax=Alitabrizicola rongguiensis TaxID=2909234 RepID=UPI001F2AE5A1|nr:hypothetical protein [Tabrizicola rongguiensis]MCF1710906.1 hypothetical protein [Tabrizicola rongguiensis]
MRRSLLILGLIVAAALVLLWFSGSLAAFQRAILSAQHEVQNALAGAIRRLKAGDPGAVTAFLGLSFGYGFFHAAGPGHGKMLIGGYGMARRVPFLRLGAIALVSSLAQALTAIGLVYAGLWLLGWGRDRMVGLTETVLADISRGMIALIGLWLVWRGWKALLAQHRAAVLDAAVDADQGHSHHHQGHHVHSHHEHDHVHDAHCGHAHGPSLEEVARVTSLRDALALIAGIAIRPCTGALFVLILTWQMGIARMGIFSALAMGLGTAMLTLLVAGMSVWAREGALATLPGTLVARALPVLQIVVGALIALATLPLLSLSL